MLVRSSRSNARMSPALRARQPQFRLVLARVDVGQERFEPVGDEFHRALQHHRERRGRHLVGVDVHLDAVRAADVLRDHAHVAFRNVEMPREDVLHHVRRLRRVIHRERVFGRVVVGEQRAAFQRDAGVAAELVGFLDHDVRFGERRVDFAGVERAREADVVAEFRMNHVLAGKRVRHVDDDRQFLPFGFDQIGGVFGLRARFGDHCGDRFALPARAVDGDRMLRRRLDAFQMPEHRDPRFAVRGDRFAVDDRDHAGHGCAPA